MELSIQERLKDLRVERGLTLEQLAEQTHLSKSALGSYEADEYKDISHYAIIKLAKFYGVTADYLLGLSETKNHPNTDLADLRLSDDMIELLKSGRVDNPLEDFLQTAEETAREGSDPEQAAMMFICKRLKLNYKKLSEEERKWLKRIAQKSDLLKNPKPQRGRK